MNQPILPNELRVGNVLMYMSDEGPMRCKIDDNDIMWCVDENKGFNTVHKPIPLTPELLVEMGFQSDNDGRNTYKYINKETYVALAPDGFFLVFASDDEEEDELYRKLNIEYLHQLQNFIHALTSEELTINTK